MIKIAYKNLGCKVNSYELNKVRDELFTFGFVEVDFDSYADIYVINTCSVTHIADRKSRQMIYRSVYNNPNAIIIAMGCSIDNIDNSSIKQDDNIIYIKNEEKNKVKDILKSYLDLHNIVYNIDKDKNKASIKTNTVDKERQVRAFIKIEDGCNQFCSYCIIPYLRGRVRSIPKK